LVETPRCGVTARIAGGTALALPARTARRAIPTIDALAVLTNVPANEIVKRGRQQWSI